MKTNSVSRRQNSSSRALLEHVLRSEDVTEAIGCLQRFQKLRGEGVTFLEPSPGVAVVVFSGCYYDLVTRFIDSIPADSTSAATAARPTAEENPDVK